MTIQIFKPHPEPDLRMNRGRGGLATRLFQGEREGTALLVCLKPVFSLLYELVTSMRGDRGRP